MYGLQSLLEYILIYIFTKDGKVVGHKGASCLMLFWASASRNQILSISLGQARAAEITPTEACMRIKVSLAKVVKDMKLVANKQPPAGKLKALRDRAVKLRSDLCKE